MCKINVKTIIQSPLADDDKKGDLLFHEIKAKAYEGESREIFLDFKDVDLVNTAFLNNAIGRLYDANEFDLSSTRIKIINMEKSMLELLKESVRTARLMYG